MVYTSIGLYEGVSDLNAMLTVLKTKFSVSPQSPGCDISQTLVQSREETRPVGLKRTAVRREKQGSMHTLGHIPRNLISSSEITNV